MPTVEIPVEKSKGKVREVTLGATAADGGTRTHTVTVGGETGLPFLHFEGEMPHRPVVAVEIYDQRPDDWSPLLQQAWGDVLDDPAAWAKAAVAAGADLIQVTLVSTHPDAQNASPADAAQTIKKVLGAVGVPLIVRGPGQPDKDNDVLVAVAEAAKGERIAMGLCEDKNYRTIVAAALAHGHVVIGSSPIDVNLAKQLNILISDVGLGLDRVLMDPTTGALGYGLEYTYSVMERLRLAAFMGDSMTQQPMICFVGHEAWRAKESKVGEGVPAAWGDWATRARTWEIVTATTLLQSGADILVLRHPDSVRVVKRTIDKLMTK